MGAGHAHHNHDHGPPTDYSRAFALGIVLNLGIVIVEFVFGVMANSRR